MAPPLFYKLEFGLASLELTLSDDRLVSKGPMSNLDIPVLAVRHFCVAALPDGDQAYDAQLIVAYEDPGGKQKSKKLNVRAVDSAFQSLLAELVRRRPDASLIHLDPSAAQSKMGVLSTTRLAWIIVLGGLAALLALGAILKFFE